MMTESNSAGPRLLWSLYYNISVCTVNQAEAASLDIPRNVHVASDPDGTIAYENAVKEVRYIVADKAMYLTKPQCSNPIHD